MGTAHTLSRTFFWSENILWKQDLACHRAIVFLGSNDSVINTAQVREYLQEENSLLIKGDSGCSAGVSMEKVLSLSTEERRLEVVWCPNLDHGQVFDIPIWRHLLRSKVLIEAGMKT